jgi:long-subunit acyl-CoA synthetase (AMP-forming)
MYMEQTLHRMQLRDLIRAPHVADTINNAFTYHATRPYLGVKLLSSPAYSYLTYGEVHERVRDFSRGLRQLTEAEMGVRHVLGEESSNEECKEKNEKKRKTKIKGKEKKTKKEEEEEAEKEEEEEEAGKDVQPAVGLCSLSRVEWIVADFASLFLGYITVPIHVPFEPAQKVTYSPLHLQPPFFLFLFF